MGLFDFVMKGMGFEGDNQPKEKRKKVKQQPQPAQSTYQKYSNFDNGLADNFAAGNVADIPGAPNFNAIGGKNMVIYAPRNNKDIQVLVDCLRRHEACIINLALLNENDAERILDFLSGAAYALRGSLKRLQGDLFLLTPEGVNIMTQAERTDS